MIYTNSGYKNTRMKTTGIRSKVRAALVQPRTPEGWEYQPAYLGNGEMVYVGECEPVLLPLDADLPEEELPTLEDLFGDFDRLVAGRAYLRLAPHAFGPRVGMLNAYEHPALAIRVRH